MGSEGQDGRLLFDRLSSDGWSLLGIGRATARSNHERAEFFDIASRTGVAAALQRFNPDAIFYLPAVHASSDASVDERDDVLFQRSLNVHVQYAVNFLEAMSARDADASFFYAGSSHVFAGSDADRQTEDTPFAPESVYGITKAAGIHACRFYRARRGVRASVGILYNHESHLRPETFVSQRIAKAAARASLGKSEKLTLGDLGACVDWGYAPEYVDAMVRISELPAADDFIIATGQPHSVREFAKEAFDHVGLRWQDHVIERPSVLTRRSSTLTGDYRRLNERTGWQPTMPFREMVRTLVDQAGRNES